MLDTFITESAERIDSLRYEMEKKQIDSFIIGMKQIGYSKEDMIKLIEMENNIMEGNE